MKPDPLDDIVSINIGGKITISALREEPCTPTPNSRDDSTAFSSASNENDKKSSAKNKTKNESSQTSAGKTTSNEQAEKR